MKLLKVWKYLEPEVKMAICSVAEESKKLDTPNFLGALAEVPDDDPGSEILARIESNSSVSFDHPKSVVTSTEPIPKDLEFSSFVKETLNFFGQHQIRSVSVAELATRLLQLGRGSTVRTLEKENKLQVAIEELNAVK